MHFLPHETKRRVIFTELKGLMCENEHIQGCVTDSPIVLAKEKDEAQLQFTFLAKQCFVL